MSESKAQPSQSHFPPPPALAPHLAVAGAKDALAFYQKAFGAEVLDEIHTPDGRVLHAHVRLPNGGVFFLMDEFPEMGTTVSVKSLPRSPIAIHIEVPDADAAWKRAVDAGAAVAHPLNDTFWGARYGQLRDPFGHIWSIASKVRDVTREERAAALAREFGGK